MYCCFYSCSSPGKGELYDPCDFSVGRQPVTLHSILIRAGRRLYGSQSGAATEPGEQEEREAFMLGTKDRQGIQI